MKTLRTIVFESPPGLPYCRAVAEVWVRGDSDPVLVGLMQEGWKLAESPKYTKVTKKSLFDRVRERLPEGYQNWEP